ncbi:MAG: PsaJ protein [Microcoleus sp. SIO2G3]|nr:PsaJ protein [Microcoleus sp. SIO2G3]
MKKSNKQLEYFVQYLSLAPVLAVVSVSVAFCLLPSAFPDKIFTLGLQSKRGYLPY